MKTIENNINIMNYYLFSFVLSEILLIEQLVAVLEFEFINYIITPVGGSKRTESLNH